MSKYTEYVSSQSASERLKADIYSKVTRIQPRRRTSNTLLKTVLSISAAAVLSLAVVLPVTLSSNKQLALRKSYSKVFSNVADAVFKSGKESGISPAIANYVVTKNIGNTGKRLINEKKAVPLKFTEPEDNSTLYGVAANVYFYSLLYLNKKFVISDDPVKFAINDIDSYYYVDGKPQECKINYDIVLHATIDRENGIVTSQMAMYEEQFWQSGPPLQMYSYLNLYVEYDFDKNEVISYTVACRSVYNESIGYNCYRYYNNFLTELDVSVADGDYQIFTAGIDSLQAEFEAQNEQIIELDSDFKKEYMSSLEYMDEMLRKK